MYIIPNKKPNTRPICIDISIVPVLDIHGPDYQSTLNWGKASDSERSAHTDKCSELLGNIHLPREAVCCSLAACDDVISNIHVFQSMKQSRARFKFKLRPCKRDEARIRADILADDLVMRNTTTYII